MAKKQKKALTPEERLAAARVPKEEWPYELPEGWEWVTGHAIFEPMESQKPEGEVFRYIDIDSIDNRNQRVVEPKFLRVDEAPSRARRKVHSGDTVFSMVRPYLKNIAYIDETLNDCIASTGFFVCKPSGFVNSKFLYWMMVSPYVVDGLNRYMKGDNSPSIRKDDVENYKYPLPPIETQQRIVNHIESLFAKLDQAKEKAQQALATSETRKAAILHQAFTGQLTAQWRQEHGVSMESWEEKTVGEYYDSQYGYTESASEENVGPKFLRITDIQDGSVDWKKVPYCKIADEDFVRYAVKPGDIVVARTGATTGKSYLIQDQVNAVFASYLIRLTVKQPGLSAEYLHLFMQSQSYWNQITDFSAGIAQPGVNAKKLKRITITIPSIKEQVIIVQKCERLLLKEKMINKAIRDTLDAIEIARKLILDLSFKGKL